MGSRRGGAVLDAPTEKYVPEREWQGVMPAPAGAHQRASAGALAAEAFAAPDDAAEYVPERGSFRFRLRGGVPRSLAGQIVLGVAALLVLSALALSGVALRGLMLHDPQFLLTTSADIQIVGNDHLTRAQVLSVFGADLERNVFRIPLVDRRADLERLPWVAHATVMRLLPSQLRVALTERTPVAFVRQGTRIGLVDGAGVLLDMPADAAGNPNYSFPVLTGLSASDTPETRAARMEVYHRFMAELDGAGATAEGKPSQSVSEVDVANPEDVKAMVTHGGSDILVHFGDGRFLDRYRAFEAHLPEWRTQYPKLASADMRYERQVVLEMQPGAGVPVNREATTGVATAKPDTSAKAVSPRKLAVNKPAVKPVTKPAAAAAGATALGAKKSDGNAKMFAALAAAHRAEAAKKTGGTAVQ